MESDIKGISTGTLQCYNFYGIFNIASDAASFGGLQQVRDCFKYKGRHAYPTSQLISVPSRAEETAGFSSRQSCLYVFSRKETTLLKLLGSCVWVRRIMNENPKHV